MTIDTEITGKGRGLNRGPERGRAWWPLVLLALAAIAFLAPASASAASQITFTVQDEAGRLQSGVYLVGYNGHPQSGGVRTDADGQLQPSASPGDTFSFSRLQPGDTVCSNPAPEGAKGVTYTVPASVPDQATVTLPTIISTSSFSNTEAERGLVGLINRDRSEHGLNPVYISTALTGAAASEISNAKNDCTWPTITPALIDSGWPDLSNSDRSKMAWAHVRSTSSPWVAYDRLRQGQVLDPNWTTIGLGQNAESEWGLYFSVGCPTDASYYSRCQITSDTGVIPPPDPPPPPPKPLKVVPGIAKVKGKDREVKFEVFIPRDPRSRRPLIPHGKLRVTRQRHGHSKQLQMRHSRNGRYFVDKHFTPGRWRVKAAFKSGNTKRWRNGSSCIKFKTPHRVSNRMKRHWVSLRARRC